MVAAGGLIYGTDITDLYLWVQGYVDCILKGTKPADLSVQLLTKFGLAINLKTAKALGLEVPPTLDLHTASRKAELAFLCFATRVGTACRPPAT